MPIENKTAKLKKNDYGRYLQKGIGYDEYKQKMAEDLVMNKDLKIREYIRLNQHRIHRVERTYQMSISLVDQVKKLKHKMYWLIVTEHWCGDASQSLPVFHKVAEISEGRIEIKLVYRDQNPELMDAYLTNETRSIPKLIQLDEQFNVTGIWGPRPAEAQKLVKLLKSDPATAANYASELHLWYAKDKQHSLETEITKLVYRASLFCPVCLS